MPDFLNIPGNIRQQYMPFTIAGDDKMQLFTFKEKMRKNNHAAVIHPFSKHLGNLIQNDSSISYTHGPDGEKKITYEQFLDEIPALQIREFVPDAKLTQTFKWFSYFKKGMDAAAKNLDSEAASGFKNVKAKLEKALNSLSEKMKGLTSGNAEILADVAAGMTSYYQDRGFNVGGDKGFAVLWIPFILYYRLTTTHTNNIYEFPTLMQNNILESDGTYGWGDDNGTDFPVLDMLGEKAKGLVNLVSSGLASTIKVNAMPAFSPAGSASATSFDIHIDLVNDSEEAAINNFLFCHTLFGNNRWLQYGFVQTGASLYDVKFPGANRYFMCKGRFICKGKGAFRTPSQKVIDGIVSHKHDKDNFGNKNTASDAWAKIPAIQTSLGKGEARSILEQTESSDGPSFDSETTSISKRAGSISSTTSMLQQLVTNAANTQEAALNTKYPNTVKAIQQKKIDSSVIEKTALSYNAAKKKIKDNSETISRFETQIKARRDHIEYEKNDIKEKYNELTNLRNTHPDDFDESGKLKPDATENVRQQYNSLQESIKTSQESIKGNEQEISYYSTQIEGLKREITDSEQQIDTLFDSQEMQPTIKSLGQDAIENAVVSVAPETWKELIKIPDVYSLTLTFTSLIPDNFNNYLYGWRAGNLDPINNYFKGTVIEKGVMEKLVDNLIEAVGGAG